VQLLKLTVIFPIITLHSNGRDNQNSIASAGLPSDTRNKVMQKLHQTGNPAELALNEYCMETNITAKSGTEPVQKSNDNFWVGDGAGQECCNCALD